MIRARQRLGKYKVVRRLARGGFADVFEARDTIEGIPVALKVPHDGLVTKATLDQFRHEVRTTAALDHPNIVPIKTAEMVDGHFVIVQPLAKQTLATRLERRISRAFALDTFEQLLAGLAHAHRHRVIHCDVKPENVLLFEGGRVRLTDFGIAKVAQRTMSAGGTGTVGFIAPEQAMGKPSPASDVFAAALVLWRMLAGVVPEWPFRWPLPGHERVADVHPDLLALLRRALDVDSSRRHRDAIKLESAYKRLLPRIKSRATRKTNRGARRGARSKAVRQDWRRVREDAFRRRHGRDLEVHHACTRCAGPVSEVMTTCPWCGVERAPHVGEVSMPRRCPRCRRGAKLDWEYCPTCWGPSIGAESSRRWSDKRYVARCTHCRGDLMAFQRYCPWCHRKIRRAWPLPGANSSCPRCAWGVSDTWDWCAWCGKGLSGGTSRGSRR